MDQLRVTKFIIGQHKALRGSRDHRGRWVDGKSGKVTRHHSQKPWLVTWVISRAIDISCRRAKVRVEVSVPGKGWAISVSTERDGQKHGM